MREKSKVLTRSATMGQNKADAKNTDKVAAAKPAEKKAPRKRVSLVDPNTKPDCKTHPSPADAWKYCTAKEGDLHDLVEQGLLLSHETLEWRACFNAQFPTVNTNGIPLFVSFCQRGVGLPISSFF